MEILLTRYGKKLFIDALYFTSSQFVKKSGYLFASKKSNHKSAIDIKNLLTEIDIENDILLIKTYIETLNKIDQPIIIGWSNLNIIINKIFEQLDEVNQKIKYLENSTKLKLWWSGKPNFIKNYDELEKLIKLFNKRLELLLKIIK